jgi:hypothetical protein
MGLGKYPTISLAAARGLMVQAYQQIKQGIDPIDERRRRAETITPKHVITFSEAADRCIAAHEATWKNAKCQTARNVDPQSASKTDPALREALGSLGAVIAQICGVWLYADRFCVCCCAAGAGSFADAGPHAPDNAVPLFDLAAVPSSRPCRPLGQRAQTPSRSAVAPTLMQSLRFQAAP